MCVCVTEFYLIPSDMFEDDFPEVEDIQQSTPAISLTPSIPSIEHTEPEVSTAHDLLTTSSDMTISHDVQKMPEVCSTYLQMQVG